MGKNTIRKIQNLVLATSFINTIVLVYQFFQGAIIFRALGSAFNLVVINAVILLVLIVIYMIVVFGKLKKKR